MKTDLKKVLVVDADAAMDQKRIEWLQMVELHDMYNKHEVYQRPNTNGGWRNTNIHYCRTCGQILMSKDVFNPNGKDRVVYRALKTQLLKRFGSEWELGQLSDLDIKHIPAEFRHFVYEQLFWKLGEGDTPDWEAAAILSCRDKSVSHTQLRHYAVTQGGFLAYAYAKSYKDFADDLKKATWSDPDIAFKFLRDSKKPMLDEDRIAISKRPHLAFQIAKEIDKKPHPVTRNGAAKAPTYALQYALEIDKSDATATTRGTTLRSVAMRNNDTAEAWMEKFGVTKNDADRVSRSRTKLGAFNYAKNIDKGPHPVTEAGVRGSFFYACRYAYEIKGAPFKGAEEACQTAGFTALEYALTFNIHTTLLQQGAYRNNRAGYLYTAFMDVRKGSYTKEMALKKSCNALAYMAVNNAWDDKDLLARASKNQLYAWIAKNCIRNLKNIAKAKRLQKQDWK